jgi:hypothetical protein
MKHYVRPLLTLAFLAGAHTLVAQNKGLTGAISTTLSDGSMVNANQYELSCSVYLDGGPGPHAPAKAAGLPDGDYYFQVTNPSGSLLFSTDPVSNRQVRVKNGVFVCLYRFRRTASSHGS